MSSLLYAKKQRQGYDVSFAERFILNLDGIGRLHSRPLRLETSGATQLVCSRHDLPSFVLSQTMSSIGCAYPASPDGFSTHTTHTLPSPNRSKKNLLLDLFEDSRFGGLPCFLPGDSNGGASRSTFFFLMGEFRLVGVGAGFLRGRPGLPFAMLVDVGWFQIMEVL